MNSLLVPGSVVAGRYRLRARMPSVGWAAFWSARDLTTGAQVTLTLVHADVIGSRDPSPGAVRRFCGRARSNAEILDVVVTDPYVVLVGPISPGQQPVQPWPVGEDPETSAAPLVGGVESWAGSPQKKFTSIALACAVVALFGVGGWYLTTNIFGGDYGDVKNVVAVPALPDSEASEVSDGRQVSDVSDTSSLSEPARSSEPSRSMDAPAAVLPVAAEAWSAVRYPDNTEKAGLAIDADPSTAWSTDRYRQPFGRTDNGIGVLVSFADSVDIDEVWMTTSYPGAVVEVRTPPDPGGTLKSTDVLGSGVLNSGATQIPLASTSDSDTLLIWVAELAPSRTQFVADFSEIGFTRK